MCDTIAGELLVCFHHSDAAGHALIEKVRGSRIEHVEFVESLGDKLGSLGLKPRACIEFEFLRLRVPVGSEAFKINYLQFFYKHELLQALGNGTMSPVTHGEVLGCSNYHLQIVPHGVLSVATPAIAFQFDAIQHATYTSLLNVNASPGNGKDRAITILDSGIERSASFRIAMERNFVDPTKANDASDDLGHGTAVASIIQDLCPGAYLNVFKVVDDNGRASEWDTLAALAAQTTAHVVNMSLSFGLDPVTLRACGRESRQSRSAVFENMVDQVLTDISAPVIVAAAGNAGTNELSFPARFGGVMAVAAVNGSKALSRFSNSSVVDQNGNPHDEVFVAPGGDDPVPAESVGHSNRSKAYWGTSMAAAYATGLVARVWSEPRHAAKDRRAIVNYLKHRADTSFPAYKSASHGNGFIRA